MQHYGVPTRLLDFTYSPYVALYFALRSREQGQSAFVEVWGIDPVALRKQAAKAIMEADEKIKQRQGLVKTSRKVSFGLANFASSLQIAQQEDAFWDKWNRKALNPCGIVREHFSANGFVSLAAPPVQNPRLSSQQGVFLFNGAESLPFEKSLEFMMEDLGGQWYKRFRVPQTILSETEEQLFQFNIHELSLFPDIQGLAGFIRQKTRLQW